jgi:hypothetical protein
MGAGSGIGTVVDKGEFLAWVTALAAASCSGPHVATPPPAGLPQVTSPAASGPSDTIADTTGNAAEPAQVAPTTTDMAPRADAEPTRPGAAMPIDCATWKGRPGPACEGIELVRADCNAMVTTLEPAVARRVLECALGRRGTTALCDLPLAECLKDELDSRSAASSPRACATIVAECAARRSRQMQSPSAKGVIRWPWLVSEQECTNAFGSVRNELRADLSQCLADGCHPTACFASSPMSIVARRDRTRKP